MCIMWFGHANWIDKKNSFYIGSADIDFFPISAIGENEQQYL